MAKRKRNSIGQFISTTHMGQKALLLPTDFQHKFVSIFMAIFILFMASPWLTLAIKSKAIQMWIYSIFQFYRDHFIGEEEIIGTNRCPKPNGDI